MSSMDTAAAPERLAFRATFTTAFGSVFGQFWMFVKASILPFVLGLAVMALVFAVSLMAPENPATALAIFALQFLGLIPTAILCIAYSRLVLVGRQAGAVPRPLLGRRTIVYTGYIALFFVLIAVPMILGSTVLFGLSGLPLGADPQVLMMQLMNQMGLTFALVSLFYLIYLYFIVRLSLVFPAVAVDHRLGLAGSWRLTRGSGLKLYLALIALTIVITIATIVIFFVASSITALFFGGIATQPGNSAEPAWATLALIAAPGYLGTIVLQYLGFAVLVAALAAAYAKLSGWGRPRQDLLERFE